MNNNKLYIIILLLLLPVAIYFFYKGNKSTLGSKEKNFSISDTASISKITFTSKQDTVILKKINNTWTLNGLYKVSQRSLHYFLSTQKRIMVQSPVSKEFKNQISSAMDTAAVVAYFEIKGRRDKKYEIYKASKKGVSYMRMGFSGRIFKVYIPAYKGDIADLYITKKTFWRDKSLFHYNASNITMVKIKYPENTKKSFTIRKNKHGHFYLDNEKADSALQRTLINYLFEYNSVKLKEYTNLALHTQKKLKAEGPFCIISVKSKNSPKKKVLLYNKPLEKEINNLGAAIEYDPHLLYGCIKNSNEWVIIRYVDVAPLLKEKSDF